MTSAVVLGQVGVHGGQRGDRAGQPRRPCGRTASGTTAPASSTAAWMSARAAATSAAVGGSECRCRSVIRTQPTSTERAATGAVPRGRTRSSRHRCRRPGTAPARGRRSRGSRRRTTAPPPPRRTPPRPVRRTARAPRRRRRRRFVRVPRRRRRDEAHPLAPSSRDARRVHVAHGERARRAPRGEPPGPVDALAEPDDLHRAVQVDERPRGRVEVGDQQPDRVRAAVDAQPPRRCGPVTASAPRPGAGSTQRPAVHHGIRASASSPSGLTPGPAASACATSTCRHLTRFGMPPAD